jgi:hypothetical protein
MMIPGKVSIHIKTNTNTPQLAFASRQGHLGVLKYLVEVWGTVLLKADEESTYMRVSFLMLKTDKIGFITLQKYAVCRYICIYTHVYRYADVCIFIYRVHINTLVCTDRETDKSIMACMVYLCLHKHTSCGLMCLYIYMYTHTHISYMNTCILTHMHTWIRNSDNL